MSPPATTPTPPAAPGPPPRPAPGPLRNGNPRGDPNLAPRCGAKARTTGCPCRAPAMPNGRCRMHGGKCRGPATPEGRERMTAANTKHGNFSAHARAERHHVRTSTARNQLTCAATLLWPYLPPDMAARLARGPAAFFPPVHPSNLPYLTPRDAMACNVETRCKTAAQAPWRQAIAQARVAKRAVHKARAASHQKQPTTPSPLAGEGRGEGSRRNALQPANAPSPAAPTTPASPPATWQDLTLLQRELAARCAGSRGPRHAQSPTDATPSPQAGPKSPARNALQRDPTTRPAGTRPPIARPTTLSAPPHPASHQSSVPTASHPSRLTLAPHQPKTPKRIAVQRENPTPPPRLTPTKAEPLRTTTFLVHMRQRQAGAHQGFGLHDLPILSPHGGASHWSMQR